MTMPDEEAGDELTRAYRRASEAQAGSPAASTRAAILAEARAAALRRKPAANDSRYIWRAAAGIAVLGVAVVLWRQTHRELAPEPTIAAPASPESRAPTEPPATVPPFKDEKAAQSSAPPAGSREEAAESVAALPESPQSDVQLSRATAGLATRAPPAAAPMQPAGAVRKDGIDYQQLLQREFPEVWNGSEPPHIVWVVMDSTGKVLRKGGLLPGATITPDQPFETQRPWQMVEVTTASGSHLQLAVMPAN